MAIGSFGSVVFEVSNRLVRTFEGMNYAINGRWAVHEVIDGKPRAEFVGPGQNEITFKVYLSESLGVNPLNELDKMQKMVEQGKTAPFILGGRIIGNEWYLEDIHNTMRQINQQGNIKVIETSITLKEYY